MKCESFPGPGADHVVTFNPMQEFIHGDDRHVTAAFDEFLRTHKKHYSRDTENSKRHGVFLQNLRYRNCQVNFCFLSTSKDFLCASFNAVVKS